MWTRTKKRLWLCRIALILILAFIWGNSTLPSELSAAFSLWVKELLGMLIPGGSGSGEAGHGLLRKLAHFSEFACLGLTLGWFWGMYVKNAVCMLLPALGCGFAVACVDECIQIFVPGRSAGFGDVMLDFSGACLSIAALMLVYYVRNKKSTIQSGGK